MLRMRIFANQTSDLRNCEIETSDFRIFCLVDVKLADFRERKCGRIFGFLKKINRIIGSTTPPAPSPHLPIELSPL
jgi:hypothetical protein